MINKKDPLIFINHILDSIKKIEKFISGKNLDNALKDDLIQSAIIRQIEIIGEAAKNLPEEFKIKYPSIKWKGIIGARDKLIHHYFGVDLDIISEIIIKEIPNLKKQIKEILKK